MGKEKKCCCFRRPKFLNELFQKLKSRRGEEDDDPGLPSSPVTQPSKHDVLNDFKKPKRHESKHSVTSDMNSSDDELEEKDVFRVNWTEVVGNGKGVTTDTDNSGELDLDLVNSTTSLSNMGARHKISVRPQRTRPSAQHRRPVKAPVAGAAMVQEEQASRVVEEVKEEEEEEEKEAEKEEEQTGRLSRSEDVSLDAEAEPKVELRVEASVEPEIEPKRSSDLDKDEEEAVVPSDEAHPEAPVSLVIPKPELRSSPVPAPKSPKPQDRKTPEPEKKEVLIVEAEQTDIETKEREKKEVEQEKTEIKPPLQDESREATPFKVVLRDTGRRKNIEEAGTLRRRDNIVDKDPTKRQTIAGDASLAIFGERKPGNRSSFVEVRHSQEVKEEAENEFSQDSKPALRAVGKCSNSAASRQSKVLDMAKLFQNQVS